MIEKYVFENKQRKEVNEKNIIDDTKGKRGFIETMVEQEQEEMRKKVGKYKKKVIGLWKEDAEEKLKSVFIKKDEHVMNASKIEGIEEKELKIVKKLSEGSLGESFI